MRHFSAFLSLLVLLGGCVQAQPTTLSDNEAIDAVYARFSEAYDQMDPEAVVALYTDDAYYLPGGDGAILHGSDALRKSFAFLAQTKEGGGQLAIAFRSVDRAISGNLAYDVGYYRLTAQRPDGTEHVSVGKFTTVLVKSDNGQWRFQVDAFSSAPETAFDAALK
ncbi:MAG TPA: SgcJ/EcaC family oxidoreductase [Rhodothermales bacterium]|nr:SgcJ/EcaC family oxidoreductase [Rhodothermales bacterium]